MLHSSGIELQGEVSYNQEPWTQEFTCCEPQKIYPQNLIHLQTFLSVKPRKFNSRDLIHVRYKICNILCLFEQIDLHVFKAVINNNKAASLCRHYC